MFLQDLQDEQLVDREGLCQLVSMVVVEMLLAEYLPVAVVVQLVCVGDVPK